VQVFDKLLRSLTPADRLIAGDSGAGYLNPNMLLAPRTISGACAFLPFPPVFWYKSDTLRPFMEQGCPMVGRRGWRIARHCTSASHTTLLDS
jgi:hypothetical protein